MWVAAVASVMAVLFLVYGWYGYRNLVAKNRCEMTYSLPKKTLVKIQNSSWDYKLWKVSNAETKRLNKYPVLFVPGHLGSVDQSRSFASYMHNDDNLLQYFAVDFDEEIIGLHASDLVTKAAYVNKAIAEIISIYDKAGKGSDLKITLLGHSYGGYIAKTSILLSNHPSQCSVAMLVMLSSPNTKAPFSPDASFHKLFYEVNKGWYHSYYHDKSHCQPKSVSSGPLALLPCSKCLKNVTVISLTGGEIDMQVQPDTSNLFSIAARPKNSTLLRQTSQRGPSLLSIKIVDTIKKTALNQIQAIARSIMSIVYPPPAPFVTSNITDTVAESSIQQPPVDPIDPSSPFANLTVESWFADIASYDEPNHISVRTSQLESLGFQVDHYAVLWCYELVSLLSSCMKSVLTTKPTNDNSDFQLHRLLKVRQADDIEDALVEPRKLGIDQLLNFIRRNETNARFESMVAEEYADMLSTLQGNHLQLYATNFIIKHLHKVPVGFFNLCMVSLLATLMLSLMGQNTNILSRIDVLDVVHHYALKNSFSKVLTLLSNLAGSLVNLCTLLAVVVAVICYRLGLSLSFIDSVVTSFIAFVLAIALKIAYAALVYLSRLLGSGFSTVLNMAGISSAINNALSRIVSANGRSYILSMLPEHLSFVLLAYALSVYGAVLSVSASGVAMSATILWMFLSTAQRLTYFLFAGFLVSSDNNSALQDDVLLLCFFATFLSLPSLRFAAQHLFVRQVASLHNAGLYDIFGVERINFLMVTGAVWFVARNLNSLGQKWKIDPYTPFVSSNDRKAVVKKGDCFHEDGGRRAVFEKAVSESSKEVGANVSVGTTYKVVKCFCPTDTSLKSSDEWCEWCRCRQCGFGNRLVAKSSEQDVSLHLDAILAGLLLVTLGYVNIYGENKAYILLYSTGAVGGLIWLRLFFSSSKFTFHNK